MEFYPSDLRFAQDSIANYFRDGRTLQESFRSLLNVDRPESVLPRMDVMHHDGFYFVTDGNRRLYLLKLLESEGLVNGKVKVNMTSFNENKYTTDNNGRSVRVRGRGNMEQMLKSILRERGHINRKRNLRSPNRNVSTNNRNMDQNYNRATIFGHIPKSIPSESHFQPQAIPPTPPQIVKPDNYNQNPTLSNSGAFSTSYNRGLSTLNTGSGSWHQNSGSATSQCATPSAVGFYRISPSETYSSSTSGGTVRASSRVADSTPTRQETTRIDMTSTMDAYSFSSNKQKRDYSTSRKKRTGCGCTIL